MLKRLLVTGLALLALALPAPAQQSTAPQADRRAVYEENTDFFGGDIRSLFDTTIEICEAACLVDAQCMALTFNIRNSACFLKSGTPAASEFEGALSARMVANTPQRGASELAFLGAGRLERSAAFAASLGRQFPVNRRSRADLFAAAQAAAQSAPRRRLGLVLTAVALEDRAEDWRLAAAIALRNDISDSRLAVSAAIAAYLRAGDAAERVASLDVLARALEASGSGRDAIPTLRLAQSIAPTAERTAAVERLVGLYGFRVFSSDAESDSARPRICVSFSDPLIPDFDYQPYVQIDGVLPVEASGNQLCIDGVVHGERYRFTLRAGLPGGRGENLSRAVPQEVYVRDRAPLVRAVGQGSVLPRRAGLAVPFATVNAPEVELVLYRIDRRNLGAVLDSELFGKPLGRGDLSRLAGRLGAEVWRGVGEVPSAPLNTDQTTLFEIGDALGAPAPGAYVLTAALPGDDAGQAAAQWFTVSDLGLASVTGADGLTLFVRGLTDAAPRAGAQATLLARNNTVLGDATTDATGRAVFDAGLMRGSGGDAPGMVQVTEGADFAFLDLTRPGFDLSDRGVEGRAAPPPIDIFMTTERGVYRPGETVFATLLARDAQVAAVGGLPLTLVARRADGVEFARWVLPDAGAGGRAHLFALPSRAMRGRWRLQVYADPDGPQLAEQDFLVEDFVPEKIDFAIDLPPEPLPQVPAPLAEVTARYLFGAPGAGLTIEGEVVVRPERGLDAFPGYEFGMVDDDAIPRRATLREVDTDAEGRASLPLVFPELGGGTAFFSADTVLRAREGSGRPVERVATHLLAPAAPRIGIRALFDGAAAEGSSPEFDVVAVGPDLAAIPLGAVRWRLEKINRWWQWYEVNGRWNYEPVTRRERVANGTAEIGDTPLRLTTPVDWGRYELKVISEARPEIRASLSFSAGWFVADAGADTPDVLEVGLDRATYAPGDTARLRVVARDAGTVAVQVLTDRVVDFRTVAVSAGETEIALPVTEDWGPGAYVNATLIRPLGEANEGPARAIGLAWVGVAPGPRLLEAAIAMPDAVDPRGPVEVVLEASGTTAGETLYATIAAVDLGILNVTGFESPDPAAHYFAQRRLGVTLRDLYGRLIDTRGGALGRVRSGGDGASANRPAPPPTEEPVAFFSGPLTIDADGSARVQFDLPDFNGTLRVMAVVWSDTGVGHAEKDVLVRDPVVVSAALPRFLAPGDDSRLRLDLTHVSGPPGDVTLAISADGPVSLGTVPAVITLGAQGRATIEVPIRGGVPGDATLKVVATTPGGRELSKTLTLGVRANDPVLARQTRLTLEPGGNLALTRDVFAGLAPGASATLAIGPLARFDVPGLLRALDRYPYGCTEQLTSRALPLLTLASVAEAAGGTPVGDTADRISDAVAAILANQSRSGGFGLWSAGGGDLWLNAYVSDFLSRAQALGHAIPDRAMTAALDNLANRVASAPDFEEGGEGLAYALLVLAREGRAAIGDLRYFADAKADDFATPLALAQLGTALAYVADQPRADRLFAQASRTALSAEDRRGYRPDYGSLLRDQAAILSLAAEVGSTAADRTGLAEAVARGLTRPENLSTQEMLWTLKAAEAEIAALSSDGVTLNGDVVTGPLVRVLDTDSMDTVTLANDGPRPLSVIVTATGQPTEPEPAQGTGYRVERWLFTLDGDPLSPDGVAQNDRLVAVLRVTPEREAEARLMVNDPLPAGLEIDNPNLLRAGDLAQLDWLRIDDVARHTQFRADRFLAAVDWRGSDSFQLAYLVRAVSPGSFHHPAASVEDMYRPGYRARTAVGRLTVRP